MIYSLWSILEQGNLCILERKTDYSRLFYRITQSISLSIWLGKCPSKRGWHFIYETAILFEGLGWNIFLKKSYKCLFPLRGGTYKLECSASLLKLNPSPHFKLNSSLKAAQSSLLNLKGYSWISRQKSKTPAPQMSTSSPQPSSEKN